MLNHSLVGPEKTYLPSVFEPRREKNHIPALGPSFSTSFCSSARSSIPEHSVGGRMNGFCRLPGRSDLLSTSVSHSRLTWTMKAVANTRGLGKAWSLSNTLSEVDNESDLFLGSCVTSMRIRSSLTPVYLNSFLNPSSQPLQQLKGTGDRQTRPINAPTESLSVHTLTSDPFLTCPLFWGVFDSPANPGA
jgi:hypothetical protein